MCLNLKMLLGESIVLIIMGVNMEKLFENKFKFLTKYDYYYKEINLSDSKRVCYKKKDKSFGLEIINHQQGDEYNFYLIKYNEIQKIKILDELSKYNIKYSQFWIKLSVHYYFKKIATLLEIYIKINLL